MRAHAERGGIVLTQSNGWLHSTLWAGKDVEVYSITISAVGG